MAESPQNVDLRRLRQLIADKCNGAIAPDAHEDLQTLLAASSRARQLYWETMAVHTGLEWQLAGKEGCDDLVARLIVEAGAERRNSANHRSTLRIVAWSSALAACLLAAALGAWALWDIDLGKQRNVIAHRDNEEPVVGRLTSLVAGTRWSFGRRSDRNSPDAFLGDTISVDVGAVELTFGSNVVAQMKAPMVLHLVSSERVQLLHGRIQVDVPEGAEGFSVETATAEIVDLGTSFSVEVVDGGTDLIVHEGEVDLKVTGTREIDQQSGAAVKRFRGGEAVRVHVDGTLSRIDNVHSADLVVSETVQSRDPLIVSVKDNLIRDDMWSYYEIVPGGLVEDAKAYVDRPHEWNGASAEGLPDYLVGADYVKTFNDDKITPDLVIELELQGPAEVYVFMDRRLTPPSWLVEKFSETGDTIGIDEDHYDESVVTGVGPGVSVDNSFSVWKYVAEHGGVVNLGPNGEPAPHGETEVIFVPAAMYGIAVVKYPGGDE